MTTEIPKLLRYEDMKRIFGISRSSLYRWEKEGDFPKRVQMGANSIAWKQEDVMEWINKRMK